MADTHLGWSVCVCVCVCFCLFVCRWREKCFFALSHDNRKRTGPLTINKLTHTHKCPLSFSPTHTHTHLHTPPHSFPCPPLLDQPPVFIPLITLSLHFLFTASSVPPFSSPFHLFSSFHLIYSSCYHPNLCVCSFIVSYCYSSPTPPFHLHLLSSPLP